MNKKFRFFLTISLLCIPIGLALSLYSLVPAKAISFIGIILSLSGCTVGCLLMAAVLVPESQQYIVTEVTRAERGNLEKTIGKDKSRKFIWILFGSLFGLIFTYFIIYAGIHNTQKSNELNTYGEIVKVRISGIGYYKKTRKAEFTFRHKNKWYHNNLPSKTFQVDDSIHIVYSTSRPEIVEWLENR